MKAIISHFSALDYWRNHFPLFSEIGHPAHVSPAEAYAYRKVDILGCVPETIIRSDSDLDILVFNDKLRRASKGIVNHAWTTPLPPTAFHQIGDLCVSSPEFVFLQLASSLSVAQLSALGCELCGYYSLARTARDQQTKDCDFPKRLTPLTNIEAIGAFLDAAERARGLAKARRALRYVVEASRSPMETRAALQLCLPPMLGGYNVPKPELNITIPLDDEGKTIANRTWCEGDLCWEKAHLDLEYNGYPHASETQMRSDAARRLGIEHMDWRVIVITSPQVFNIDQFETVAKEVAAHLKHRLHPRILGHTAARMRLHEEMDTWLD